jgi:IS30 family transposase
MPYRHFTSDERDALQVFLDKGLDVEQIARILRKHGSSIYREISRNSDKDLGLYFSRLAETASRNRRTSSCTCPKRGNMQLMHDVETRIREDHSPEQVAGRLRLEHPNNPDMQVSYETIYQHIYAKIRNGSEDLRSHLRQNRKKRHTRLSGKKKRGNISNRHFIEERPSIVQEKSRIGDWEGDTVEGSGNKRCIATFVDRATKYLIAIPLKDKTAPELRREVYWIFSCIPKIFRKTITVDNGSEFAEHKSLEKALGIHIYFAHPYHSWERGLNEHTNGLLRQYLPKKQRFDHLSRKQLAEYVEKINNRPRKSLGYQTPCELMPEVTFALRI